jgi:hypothetical protein
MREQQWLQPQPPGLLQQMTWHLIYLRLATAREIWALLSHPLCPKIRPQVSRIGLPASGQSECQSECLSGFQSGCRLKLQSNHRPWHRLGHQFEDQSVCRSTNQSDFQFGLQFEHLSEQPWFHHPSSLKLVLVGQ